MEMFVPRKEKKETVSISIPHDLLQRLNNAAAAYDLSRSELVSQCVAFTLETMEGKES